MGISPDLGVSAGVATALNIFSLLTLPSTDEMDKEISTVNEHFRRLVPQLFSAERYDPKQPSHQPVEVLSLLVVDHIERLVRYFSICWIMCQHNFYVKTLVEGEDKLKQTLVFHGTLVLTWQDQRLIWEPQDYGNLRKLSFTGQELNWFWTPGVTVRGVALPTRPVVLYQNTVFTLTSDGNIVAEISVTLKAACRFDLQQYPNDNQTCHIMLFSPLYSTSMSFRIVNLVFQIKSLYTPNALFYVNFSPTSSMVTRESFFSENKFSAKTADFVLTGLESKRFYAYAKGFTTNQTEADIFSSMTNTVIRYQLMFRRNIAWHFYISTVALPMVCTEIMAFIAFGVGAVKPSASLLWLLVCFALQFGNNIRLSYDLPVDYESEPFCVIVSRILVFENLCLIAIRIMLTYISSKVVKKEDKGGEVVATKVWNIFDRKMIDICETFLVYFLALEAVILFWLIL